MSSIAAESFDLLPLEGCRLVVAPDLFFGKMPNKRGRSHLIGGRRHHSRNAEQLSRSKRETRAEMAGELPRGGRQAALERVIAHDADEVDDPDEDDIPSPWRNAVAYSRLSRRFEQRRRREEEREVRGRETRKRISRIATNMSERCHSRKVLRQTDPESATARLEHYEVLVQAAKTTAEAEGYMELWLDAELELIDAELAAEDLTRIVAA